MTLTSYNTLAEPNNSWSNQELPLSNEEEQQISEILYKYRDAPFNSYTYVRIQHELEALGLSPERLSKEDDTFNPSRYFLMMLMELRQA